MMDSLLSCYVLDYIIRKTEKLCWEGNENIFTGSRLHSCSLEADEYILSSSLLPQPREVFSRLEKVTCYQINDVGILFRLFLDHVNTVQYYFLVSWIGGGSRKTLHENFRSSKTDRL